MVESETLASERRKQHESYVIIILTKSASNSSRYEKHPY